MHTNYLDRLVQLIRQCEIYQGKTRVNDWNEAFEYVIVQFMQTRQNRGKLFFIGNGGSAAIASHMTADFMKNGRMRAISLYDASILTCLGNDCGYEQVFAESLEMLAEDGDLLVAVSSSGNSPNIVQAIETARKNTMSVITFSGFRPDNRIRSMGDYNIYVPVEHYGMVESIHTLLLQQIADELLSRKE